MMPLSDGDNDFNPIPSVMKEDLDNQDIIDDDRQVLNDRVLGIINIF